MRKEKYCPDVINILRGLATMFVFLLHGRSYVRGIDACSNPLVFITATPAWGGVWIFVIISCYLLGLGFIKNKYPLYNAAGKISFAQILRFYIKRFIRIAPIYYLYCFAFEFFTDKTFLFSNPAIFLKIITFTFNGNGGITGIGHLWYLSLAMQIYLIMPFVYLILNKLKHRNTYRKCFGVCLGFGLLLRIVLYYGNLDWYTWVYTFIGANLDMVLCGTLLAFLTMVPSNKSRDRVIKKSTHICCIFQFILLILYNCYIYHIGTEENIHIYQYILPTMYIMAVSLLILVFHKPLERKTNKQGFYLLKIVDWFAPYSFGFYILHINMFTYFERSIGLLEFYNNIGLLGRYIIFFGTTFGATICGAVILKYAVDGLTFTIKKNIKF